MRRPGTHQTIKRTVLGIGLTIILGACGGGGGGGGSAPPGTNDTGNGPILPAPQGAQIIERDTQLRLSWNLVSGADSYNIYWDTQPSVSKSSNRISNATPPFTHTGLDNGTVYYYVVSAVRNGETTDTESDVSSSVSGRPSVIGVPSISQITPDNGQNNLAWSTITGADSYNIYWDTSPTVTTSSNKITGATPPFTHLGLTNDIPYYYRVSAVQDGINAEPAIESTLSITEMGAPIVLACSAAEPNVMLLLDNSGSMDHIIWDGGYDDSVDYSTGGFTDWSVNRWNANQRNITIRNEASCSNNVCVITGENALAETKTLTMPDPLNNGNTWYSGNYLNYLFNTFPDGSNLVNGPNTIPNKTRLSTMQDAVNLMLSTTQSVRFGLTTFNAGNGGTIVAANGSPNLNIMTAVSTLDANGSTPLAEAMYEITRYFRGLDGFHDAGVNYFSPIQYRCQKNYVIVVTDGLPSNDTTYDINDIDIAPTCARLANLSPPEAAEPCSLPNWDQIDNDGPNPGGNNEGDSLYFDDMVKFAYDVDMRTVDIDFDGNSFDSAPFPIQNIETYVVGFSIDSEVLADAAHYGSGLKASDPRAIPATHYYTTNSEAQLATYLSLIIDRIKSQ